MGGTRSSKGAGCQDIFGQMSSIKTLSHLMSKLLIFITTKLLKISVRISIHKAKLIYVPVSKMPIIVSESRDEDPESGLGWESISKAV